MKKLFSAVAFLLFVLALVWLFTYDSSQTNYTASRRSTPNLNQNRNDRIVRTTPTVVMSSNEQPQQPNENYRPTSTTFEEPYPPAPQTTGQAATVNVPNAKSSGSYVGVFGTKEYVRQGQTGVYKGALDDSGKPAGFGVLEYKNGNIFVGEYKNGERHGLGYSMFRANGKVKQRNYNNGQAEVEKDRNDLVIKSKTYAREGQSGTYVGPFKNNVPHGLGVYNYSNGDIFVGEYVNNTRHGKGTLCKGNGQCYQQVYQNGELVTN